MKSMIMTSFACMLLCAVLMPNKGLSQKYFKGEAHISIPDAKSGKKYEGKIEAIVINHEEQWFSSLKEKGELSYMLGICHAINKPLCTFLTEEEYLNVVNLKVEGKNYKLKGVKIKKATEKNGRLHVTLKCDVHPWM